jgi:hypothetical protein
MSTSAVKPSSLASLPPPSSSLSRGASAAAAAGAGAGAAASPSAADRRDFKGASSTSSASAADSLLESRIEAIIEKRLAALAAVKALPKTPAIPNANTDARMGRGILAQLRDNARLSDDDGDGADRTSDIEDSDADKEAPADDSAAAAAAAPPSGGARTSAARRARTRIAPQMLRNCATYGSVTAWVKQTDWKSGRNKHECEALARAVDALLAEGTSAKSTGVEILMRRLSGVHLADQHSEWQLADSVAWNPLGNSLLPRDEVTRALKEADQLKRLTSNMSNGGFRYKRDGARPSRDDRRDGGMSAKPKNAWQNKKKSPAQSTPSPASGAAADK